MALIVDNNGNPIGNTGIFENSTSADGITYDNTDSGLEAANVQDAIDEINDILHDKFVIVNKSVTTDQYGFFRAEDVLKPYTDNGYKVLMAHSLNSNAYAFINSISGYLYAFDGQTAPHTVSNQTANIMFILIKIQ